MTITAYHGDCRFILPLLPPGSIDVCITDPPYGDTELAWDRQCSGWIERVARVLKPSASIWVFGSLRFLAPLFAQMAHAGFVYSQDLVWEKQNGSGFLTDRFRRVHEHAVLFYRGKWSDVYHDTQYTLDAQARTIRHKGRPSHWHGTTGPAVYTSEDGGPRMQRSVIRAPNEHRKGIHPTQKPLDILRPMVRYSCPPGGTVLDCFAGSGSTAKAAQLEERHSIVIEEDAVIADAMRSWLSLDAIASATELPDHLATVPIGSCHASQFPLSLTSPPPSQQASP